MARPSSTPARRRFNTLQRVVLPTDKDPEALALYIDAETWGEVDGRPVRLTDENRIDDVLGRQKFRVRAGKRVSFGTYFNAFPAGYWQRWTSIPSVRLSIKTSGRGEVLIYRSNALGVAAHIDSSTVSGKGETTTFDLPLDTFIDGGWYWFDLVAGAHDLTLESADYATEHAPNRTGKATVAITTFNRPEYCVEVIRALNSEAALATVVDAVMVIDQGTKLVSDQKAYPAIAKKYGPRLKHIRQPNLGGSGGFSRGMIEALARKDSEFVLLLDDDVIVEPEGVIRAVTFGRYTHEATIVGGHMFDMFDRSQLHAFSEKVDLDKFMWGVKYQDQFRHNFTQSNLRQTPWLHERADVDFNGWWMSLIPLEIVRKIGLSLPVFIKWDDSEYSLRARDAGHATVSFPGAAVWHVSWADKDDFSDWQAYFHGRNRWVAALLHSPYPHGGKFVIDSWMHSFKQLLTMRYYPSELYFMALDDVKKGPSALHPMMGTRLGEVRATAAEFSETSIIRDPAAMPEPLSTVDISPTQTRPPGWRLLLWLTKTTVRHMRPVPKAHRGERPQAALTAAQATWWRLGNYDSVMVSLADGSGKAIYRRDPKQFKRRFQHTLKMHRELRKSWPELAATYRAGLAEMTSVEAWKRTIGIK